MADFDAGLLAATGQPRPRVVVLPTASFPDGESGVPALGGDGRRHFSALGAEVEPVLIRDRGEGRRRRACPGDREADSSTCRTVERATSSMRSRDRAPAGPSGTRAGGGDRGRLLGGGDGPGRPAMGVPRRLVPSPVRWRGDSACPGLSVISRYDTRPEALCAVLAMRAPRGSVVVGIDTDTAVVWPRRIVAGARTVARHRVARSAPRAVSTGDAFRL
jgi:hypothetical protein